MSWFIPPVCMCVCTNFFVCKNCLYSGLHFNHFFSAYVGLIVKWTVIWHNDGRLSRAGGSRAVGDVKADGDLRGRKKKSCMQSLWAPDAKWQRGKRNNIDKRWLCWVWGRAISHAVNGEGGVSQQFDWGWVLIRPLHRATGHRAHRARTQAESQIKPVMRGRAEVINTSNVGSQLW